MGLPAGGPPIYPNPGICRSRTGDPTDMSPAFRAAPFVTISFGVGLALSFDPSSACVQPDPGPMRYASPGSGWSVSSS